MKIRKTTPEDMDAVRSIYEKARQYMRQNGNLHQWINGYPGLELIKKDIRDKSSYVCIDDNQIVGTFCFIRGLDPAYRNIYEGNWINDKPYGVIHRLASASHRKGAASYCIDWCFRKCRNLRIDTHEDNYIMQNLLAKNGFQRCGIIYLEDGSPRLAFQKTDEENGHDKYNCT